MTPQTSDATATDSTRRLVVFAPYYAPHVGGVESYAAELHDRLLAAGRFDEILVVSSRLPDGAPAESRERPGLRVIRYPASEPVANFPMPRLWSSEYRAVMAAVTAFDPGLAMTHTRFFPGAALGARWARGHRVPHIHVEHGSSFVQVSSPVVRAVAWAYDHLVGRWTIRAATRVVAISQSTARFVQQLAGRTATVVHRGFDDHLGTVRAAPISTTGPVHLCFVGRLISSKGIAELERALLDLEGQEWTLDIVGSGPLEAPLRTALGSLGERVIVHGELDHAATLRILAASDIVLHPSYTEGLPTVVVEAALLGRCVLATDVGGTNEIIEDGVSGRLVGARDTDALREALAELLDSPQLRIGFGARAAERTNATFRWSGCLAALDREFALASSAASG